MRQLQLANWFWLKFWDKIKLNYIEKWPIGRIHAQFLIGKCFIAKNISTFSLHLASLGSKLDVSRQIFSHVWNVKLKMMHMKTGKVVSRDAWNKKHWVRELRKIVILVSGKSNLKFTCFTPRLHNFALDENAWSITEDLAIFTFMHIQMYLWDSKASYYVLFYLYFVQYVFYIAIVPFLPSLLPVFACFN